MPNQRDAEYDGVTAVTARLDFDQLVSLFEENARRIELLRNEPADIQAQSWVPLELRKATLLKAAHVFGNHAFTCVLSAPPAFAKDNAEWTVGMLRQDGRPRQWADQHLGPHVWLAAHCIYTLRNKVLFHVDSSLGKGGHSIGDDPRNHRLSMVAKSDDSVDERLVVVGELARVHSGREPVAAVHLPPSVVGGNDPWGPEHRFHETLAWLFFTVPPMSADRKTVDGLVHDYGLSTSFTMRELVSYVDAFVAQAPLDH